MKTMASILVIDDEPAFQRLVGNWFCEQGFEVTQALTAEQARVLVPAQHFALVLLDLAMPPSFVPEDGLKLLSVFTHVPVIVLTGHGDRQLALKAIKLGAWDFLNKPVDPDMLQVVVDRALEKHALQQELVHLRKQAKLVPQGNTLGILGVSQSINQLRELITRIAPSNVSVLISGPSGTGKELVAQAVHNLSKGKAKRLVSVHCGAIPESLMESELFGHTKGSFTGADQDRVGLIETADGGTLFLDEIGEMPLSMQVKLLRVLQQGSFFPVGGREEIRVNFRVVSATHRDLEQMVQAQTFREDLYYRIKGVKLLTPPLNKRIEDIPLLAKAFISEIALRYNTEVKPIAADALQWMMMQAWKGNVRELQNCLESAFALSGDNAAITAADLGLTSNEVVNSHGNENLSLEQHIQTLEKRLILSALNETGHNHTKTAERLKISRAGLLKKMTRLQLR